LTGQVLLGAIGNTRDWYADATTILLQFVSCVLLRDGFQLLQTLGRALRLRTDSQYCSFYPSLKKEASLKGRCYWRRRRFGSFYIDASSSDRGF
jgi:hypothetical protein